ncbi:G-protein coupled receptor 84-like [Biomphalaria glabrata]|uniref:G-protein coupled receptor 84-like n=1 Tax=Biomphalaria glabrata TaxID=6526 RepID=A0A9W3A6X1_BIOGL|nr:G-protein coupled receptor 84-like [Biomphalaria glabrata]
MCSRMAAERGVSKTDINLMKSLFAVFVCLAVFMTPYMMSLLLDIDNSWTSSAHVACTCTSILNSSINWLLYGLMNNQLRQGYSDLLNGFIRLIKVKQDNEFMVIDCQQKQETSLENTC